MLSVMVTSTGSQCNFSLRVKINIRDIEVRRITRIYAITAGHKIIVQVVLWQVLESQMLKFLVLDANLNYFFLFFT